MKFKLADQIRTLLDEARKEYGPARWDEDGVEAYIIELVCE